MAGRKVKLGYIRNNASRKFSYKKRVNGILKKTQELSILCGVDACAVVYGQDNPAPVVWPTSDAEAKRILLESKAIPDICLSQRKFSQESFLTQTVAKSNEKILRLQRRNQDMEMQNVMVEVLFGRPIEQIPFADLEDLVRVIEDRVRTFQHRVRVLESGDNNDNPAAAINRD